MSMAQDDHGFVWLGTSDGLNRFDGYNTEIFRFTLRDTNCICGNEVFDLVNDNRGNLWIATSNCLNKFNLEDYSFKHYGSNPTWDKEISGNYVSALQLIGDRLSVITENGLDILNIVTDEVINVQFPSIATVKFVVPYRDEGLLVTTSTGLYIYEFEQDQLASLEEFNNIDYTKSDIQAAWISNEDLFVCNLNGIIRYNLTTHAKKQLYETEFMITRDIKQWKNSLAFCTSKGIMTYDEDNQEFKHGAKHGYPEWSALKSFVKSDSEIWFSTIGAGVFRYSAHERLFNTLTIDSKQIGMSKANNVWHLTHDDNEILVSANERVFTIDENREIQSLSESHSIDLPSIKFVLNVSRDDDDIWICTYDAGIYHVNFSEKHVNNYSMSNPEPTRIGSNTVRHSLVLDDEVLFSTDNGLFSLDRDSDEMKEIHFNENLKNNSIAKNVLFTYSDTRSKLWIGTKNGLFVEQDDGSYLCFSTRSDPALSNSRIRNINQVSDSIYYIGTSSGINVFDYYNKSVAYIDASNGLNNDVIYGLEIDADLDIWVSTTKGISMIDGDGRISNYYPNDGFFEQEFTVNASAKDDNGNIYFGGLSGVTYFDPLKAKNLDEVKTPIITKIEILPQRGEEEFVLKYPLSKSHEFTHAQSNFIINFTSVDFTNPENKSFYYKLEGYNDEWIKVDGDPEVQFMNLDEGTYNFKVRTAYRNGELSRNISSIKIKINPPFYNSFLFRIVTGLSLLFIGTFVYRARIKSVENSNLKLQEIVRDQTKKLKVANDLRGTFLREVPEPLVIFNPKNEVTFSNDQYNKLKFENLSEPKANSDSSQQLDDYIFAGVLKVSEENLQIYESDLTLNEKFLQLKFSRMIVGDDDYGTSVLLRDVTRVKNAENILKENEVLFRSYFEKSPIGIVYVIDPSKPISNCNATFSEMLGMDKSDALTKTMMELTFEDDLEQDTDKFRQAFDNKLEYLFEPNKRLIRPDGQILMTETHLTFIYDKDNNYQYLFGLIHDVTAQRESQEKLMRARTKLVQSEKLAALGQITAGVAHEINNPVNFIYNGVNNLKTLIEALKSEQYKDVKSIYKDINEMLTAVEDGANRTAEIVRSLRLFTREDVTNQVRYNIVSGLESTIKLLSNKLHGITVELNYSFRDYEINCYPGQLNQVFMNVLLNSIEAMDGKGNIEINIIERRGSVDIIIADTGSGISPSISTMIYEPFFSTKGPKNGTGLGLSISQSIIDKHNGSITFENNDPKGTKCIITLPT